MKVFFRLLWIRLNMAYLILFGRKRHMILLRLDSKQFADCLSGKDTELSISYVCLQKYNVVQIIKTFSDSIDFADEVLMKAKYDADLDEYLSRTN